MPAAEPSGEYEVDISLDLSAVYGKITDRRTITIEQPPDDILERRLAELKSKEADTRRTAVADLAFFGEDGDRVFPALVACLEDGDEEVRKGAVYSMSGYREQIDEQPDVIIGILKNKKFDGNIRAYATYLLSRVKDGDRVFPNLLACLEDSDENVRTRAAYSMLQYSGQMETRPDVFIGILGNEKLDAGVRSYCAYRLGKNGPLIEKVRKALEDALETFKGSENENSVMFGLESFKKRMKEKSRNTR